MDFLSPFFTLAGVRSASDRTLKAGVQPPPQKLSEKASSDRPEAPSFGLLETK